MQISEALGDFRRDIAFALRMFARRRAFFSAAIVTLGVGIGMATAMFSIADGVLLRPLPVEQPERVTVVSARDPATGMEHLPFPHAVFRAVRDESRSFSEVAALDYNGAFPRPVHIGSEATNLNVAFVTGNLFRLLGVDPELGRGLQPEDDRIDAAPVVAISRGLWERRFGSDRGVIGRTLRLMGREATIVGVMPRGFDFPGSAEVWAPTFPFTSLAGTDSSWVFVHLVGRLSPGATADQARLELNDRLERGEALLPPVVRDLTTHLRPLEDHVLGGVRGLVRALMGAVGLLLLVTVTNVATLLLEQAVQRRHEFGVRASLGATSSRIGVQVFTESLLLATLGGLLGVAVAHGLVDALTALAPADLPRADAVTIDGRVLLFALAVSLGAALLFGLAPTLRLARRDISSQLRSRGRGVAADRDAAAAQGALVVMQVALTVVVLAGAGLLLRSLSGLHDLDWGMAKERLVLAQFSPPEESTALDPARFDSHVDRLIQAAGNVPGVVSAAPVLMPPFAGASGWDARLVAEDQPFDQQANGPLVNLEIASPDYFRTLGIDLLGGRVVSQEDGSAGPPVAVLSESAARLAWPGQDVIGRRIRVGGEEAPWRTVVGVVADTRYRELTRIRPTVYLPRTQFPGNPMFLAIRTRGEPTGVIAGIRSAAARAWPGVTFPVIRPLTAYASEPLARPRFAAALFTAFAMVALLLSCVGLYGLMAAHVRQRRREIGIRMALGAQEGGVLLAVLARGTLLALAGLAFGTTAALALTRLLGSLLHGVRPTDPATFVGVAAVLLAASGLAIYLPARRATRVDPMRVLRSD